MKWFDWHTVRDYFQQLVTYLSGDARYRVELAPGSRTSHIDFERGRIVVDPEYHLRTTPEHQFRATQAYLKHECSHALFTTPRPHGDPITFALFNLLEDERIERAFVRVAPGARADFELLKRKHRKDLARLAGDDDPADVLLALFHRREMSRLRGRLSPRNRRLFRRVWPLAREAFEAPESAQVWQLAERILQLLGLDRVASQAVPARLPTHACAGGHGERPDDAVVAFDHTALPAVADPSARTLRDLLPGSASSGGTAPSDGSAITARPYRDLVNAAAPHAARLVDYLRKLRSYARRPRHAEQGRRLDMRAYLRGDARPFRHKVDEDAGQARVAIGCLVDCSGSMEGLMPAVRLGLTILHLACDELEIPHAIWAFASWREPIRTVKEFDDPPTFVPAYIAGLEADGLTHLLPALQHVVPRFEPLGAETELLLVIHDGEPDDPARCRTYLASLGRPRVQGIYLGDGEASRLRELFGRDVIATPPDRLPELLSAVVESAAPR